jgi:endonuclease YncB( thermonuclease family)
MRIYFLALLFLPLATLADVSGRVVAVTDGDTIKVLDADNAEHKVRLTGIDAPEKGQPYGTASRNHLASMVAGKEVKVESIKSDRYGRVLGKVWVQPGDCPSCGKTLNTNHAQILAGIAARANRMAVGANVGYQLKVAGRDKSVSLQAAEI